MKDDPADHLFYTPPGVDFATQLVLGLQERLRAQPPEAMARVRLFLNSQRMRRRVTQVFTTAGASFLPTMTVVSELGSHVALSDLPAAVPELRQHLELARLVKQLLLAQPELAPLSARFDLADSLASLLTEMQDEAVSPDVLARLDVSGHSAHWARTQSFLNIIAPLFQKTTNPAMRQREAVLRLSENWQDRPPVDPVIIAGSTGSRGTTALLMQAIARLATGAVVLPGFDTDLPEEVWSGMNDVMADEDHPQFRFRKLMLALTVSPSALRPWRDVQPYNPGRNRLVSLALRPAPVTDQWLVDGKALPDLLDVTQDLSLIEATSPRDEATAISLILRHAVENGHRAALITPDRGLSRRVSANLTRWNLVPDDSAGSPLAMSAVGRLLRHIAQALTSPMTADHVLVLLKHPIASAGGNRPQHLILTRRLEAELRRNGPAFPDAASILTWASKVGAEIPPSWAEWVAKLLSQMTVTPAVPLTEHVDRHIALLHLITQGPDASVANVAWAGSAGAEALNLMTLLQSEAPYGDIMAASDYASFFETQINKGEVRESYTPHPLVAFYGHREAREMQADIVVIGGLTDGIWPAMGDPDPWLNRKMRRDAGLLLPERQIGLSAHDFQQAMAAQKVILTRSVRDAEAETVPSRWLNRLCNLMEGLPDRNGPKALAAMRARGRVWLNRARVMDRPTPAHRADPGLQPAQRPSPRPPLSSRPDRLPLSRVSTLIRDPYAIYARYVLRLKSLDPLRQEPQDRDRGILIHRILEDFVKTRLPGEPQDQARRRLLTIAEAVLQDGTPFPSARLLWLARLERAADHLLRQDAKYDGHPVLVEQQGSIRVGQTGFTLFGTPDRIDLLPDGRLHLIDYKTGTPPSKAQQEAFDKQLLLAAVMAEQGGFSELGAVDVARISYIGLGSGEKSVETEISAEGLAEQWTRFCLLVAAYGKAETGYAARRAVFETRFEFDYDHLSRFGEWQMSDRAVAIPVGGSDEPE